ncbi:MAG: c-type cytochrome [Pseudomonadota bacterium]|nr:c-type cytochrome [Pseudomonadota bacterium]
MAEIERKADPRKRRRFVVAAGLLVAGVAWASPWDIDMVDSYASKAYEWKMRPTPEASVQRAPTGPKTPGAYQVAYVAPVDRVTESDALVNPYPADAAALAEGKALLQVTCAPCHGVDGKGGGPVTQNDPAKDIRRFPLPAPLLSGPGAVTALRSDGYIYATIRNGGALMPAYGISLTDHERWSIVSYMRTLEGAQLAPPTTPPVPAAVPAAVPAKGGTEG